MGGDEEAIAFLAANKKYQLTKTLLAINLIRPIVSKQPSALEGVISSVVRDFLTSPSILLCTETLMIACEQR